MTPGISVNGIAATGGGHFSMPHSGAWFLDAALVSDAPASGRVSCEVQGLLLSGTVVPEESGTFGLQRKVRVVGGANGWQRLVRARGYHNDAGVSAELVAKDAARDCGETLASFEARARTLGADFARKAGPASAALEIASGGFNWWVEPDGTTRVASSRPAHTPAPGSYEVLEFDPRSRTAVLAVDDLSAIRVGSVLTERLDAPETIQAFDVEVTGETLRVRAWCGKGATGTNEIGDLLQTIVRRTMDRRIFGVHRYRVVNMAGDRVNVQAADSADGVPDLLSLKMNAGIAGGHAVLARGAEVRVWFLAGDPGRPEICGYASKGEAGHVPESLTLCGSEFAVARQGDLVQIPSTGVHVIFDLPPGGSPTPSPMMTLTPYLVSFGSGPVPPLLIPPTLALAGAQFGYVDSGSPKVRA
jgi:hypothetical protein